MAPRTAAAALGASPARARARWRRCCCCTGHDSTWFSTMCGGSGRDGAADRQQQQQQQQQEAVFASRGGVSDSLTHGLIDHYRRMRGPTGYGSDSTAEEVSRGWAGHGKVAVVTGGNSGIGEESVRVLAARGCDVVMGVRSLDRGYAAKQRIQTSRDSSSCSDDDDSRGKGDDTKISSRVGHIDVQQLDLSSLASVKRFCNDFTASGSRLDIVLCNAAVMACPYALSADGHEMQFATNHLGHALLAKLLLPRLLDTAREHGTEGRLIFTASHAHQTPYWKGIRFGRLDDRRSYSRWPAYGQSKLCNLLTARRMAEQLRNAPVAVASCHPGVVDTGLTRHMPITKPFYKLFAFIFKSIPAGAATQIYLVTTPRIERGEYYQDVNVAPSSSHAHSRALSEQLAAVSNDIFNAAGMLEAEPEDVLKQYT